MTEYKGDKTFFRRLKILMVVKFLIVAAILGPYFIRNDSFVGVMSLLAFALMCVAFYVYQIHKFPSLCVTLSESKLLWTFGKKCRTFEVNKMSCVQLKSQALTQMKEVCFRYKGEPYCIQNLAEVHELYSELIAKKLTDVSIEEKTGLKAVTVHEILYALFVVYMLVLLLFGFSESYLGTLFAIIVCHFCVIRHSFSKNGTFSRANELILAYIFMIAQVMFSSLMIIRFFN